MVEKATTRQKGPSGPPVSLETRRVGEKMLEWEHVPERPGPQTPGRAAQENENDTGWCPEGLGRSICCSLCSVSNSLSYTQPFQINLFSLCRYDSVCYRFNRRDFNLKLLKKNSQMCFVAYLSKQVNFGCKYFGVFWKKILKWDIESKRIDPHLLKASLRECVCESVICSVNPPIKQLI